MATFSSSGVCGATKPSDDWAEEGAGSALRSSLPFGVRGKGREVDDRGRDEILGKRILQRGDHRRLVKLERRTCFAHDISDEPLFSRLVFPNDHRAIEHVGLSLERSFDFSRLDAVTTKLDLIVRASEELNDAITAPAREIACLV